MTLKHLACLAMPSLMLGLASASATGDNPVVLDPIAVRGDLITYSVKEALDDRHQAPNSVSVIDGTQLNQFNDLSVGDAIRRLPGVTFAGVNRSRDVKLRGIGSEYTQILIDGRPIADGNSSRNMEVDRLPASMIERIEIIRSPTADLAGAGVAGTLNIVTRRDFTTPTGGIRLGAGHVERNGTTGDIGLHQAGTQGDLRYFIAGNYQRRLLEESATEHTFDAARQRDGGSEQQQNRTFDEYSVLGRFDYALDARNSLMLQPTLFRTVEERDQTDWSLNANGQRGGWTDELRDRTREVYGARLSWEHLQHSDAIDTYYLAYQYGNEDTERESRRHNASGVQNRHELRGSDIRFSTVSGGYETRFVQGRHQVSAGLGSMLSKRDEEDTRIRDGVPIAPNLQRDYDVEELIHHLWVSDSITVSDNGLLTLGARLEHSRTDTTGHDGTERKLSRSDFNPSLHYRHTLAEDVDLRVGLARTLRRPDLRELTPTASANGGTVLDPDKGGNAEVRPEHAWGADIGTDWYLADRLGLVSLNTFARRISDKIEDHTRLENGRYVARPHNVGTGRLYGAELEGRLPLAHFNLPELTLWANATAMRSRLRDQQTGRTRRFDKQPDYIANLGMDYFLPGLRTTLGININRTFAYDQTIGSADGSREHSRYDAQTRLDLSANVAASQRWSMSLSALNITNTRERVQITQYDTTGAVAGYVSGREPSNTTYYASTSYSW